MKQRNCHARRKVKSKKMRLANFFKRVLAKRAIKGEKNLPASAHIEAQMAMSRQSFDLMQYLKTSHKGKRNQRQKRKIWRQVPHSRRKAA